MIADLAEPRIRFSKLRALLLELGFRETVVPDSHIGFRHELSDTTIMLPIYKGDDLLLPRHVVPVRTLLDGKGLLEGDEFDQMLASGSVKQTAS